MNKEIQNNIPFLKAQLNIETLTIEVVKPKRNFINKLWIDKLLDSTVMVEYTICQGVQT